ncbi:hypothetical protein ACFO5Q_18855 [Kordiimonas lipolytica]|uniref:Uncharacterized protein n=1 Tax=Kordiimonas lipolytica TaxID=1662421 RepID=A0ABV8UGQ5_9PROT|nr:hypothetical protein [Kordiimonas lipolytica]
MKTVKHKRHRHSEGPGYYKWVVTGLAALGLVHLCYRVAGEHFDSFGGALMTVWVLLPAFGAVKVGAQGVIKGGLPALIGTLFLVANYFLPIVGYVGWEDGLSTPVLLVSPAIHWVVVFAVSVLLKALKR